MLKSRTIQSRIPENIYEAAKSVFDAEGLTMSDAVRRFVTKVAYDKVISEDIYKPFKPNQTTLDAFAEAERGEFIRVSSVEELFAGLD